jgi:hypothetical protein
MFQVINEGKLPNGGNRPRLTKVVLSTSAQQLEGLRNSKNFRNSVAFLKILIRPSMFAEERKLDYDLCYH